jgi:glycosyltransferase involved in cell wall biosynthesis
MGKPRVLVITTAYHHKHRFRLHNFLPYLSKYLDISVIDIPSLGYDKSEEETLFEFLSRVVREILIKPIKVTDGDGVEVYTLRALFPGDFGALTSIPMLSIVLRKLRHRKYHAILASPFLAGFLALVSRRIPGNTPIVYEDVDRFYDFFRSPLTRSFAKAFEYAVLKDVDVAIAASPHLYVEDVNLRKGKNTYFVPNGIEYRRIREVAERVKDRDKYSVVYVGAIEWWSGLDIAVKAFKHIVERIPNAKLYIIGEYRTPFGTYLRRLIKDLDLNRNIVLLGRRPYEFVIRFLPRCKIGILTFPRSEVTIKAFPYKVLEYCASGTPVVMTNVTILSKLVRGYGAGYVCEVGDLDCLVTNIIELMVDEQLWRECSENAIRLASMFDVEKLAKIEARIIASLGG